MRKTYHWDPETRAMVPGPSPRKTDSDSGDGWRFSDRVYSSSPFVAPDGTVINSKRKHREYMKKNGLTTVDDFTQTWAKKAKEREAFYSGKPYDSESRKRDLVESIRKLGGEI